MAETTLNAGATSLAAANWADTTGFANGAQLLIDGTRVGNQNITAGLDQSATNIEYLDVINYGGTIGGAAGPLKCDADGTAESATSVVSRVRWWSPGTLYFSAAGGNTLAHYFQQRGGTCNIASGILKNVHVDSGVFYCADAVSGSGVWHLQGGSGTFDYHASNVIAEAWARSGTWTFAKKPTALYIMSGASVTLDCQALTPTNIYMLGGTLRLISAGGITNFYGFAGTLDAGNLQRSVTAGSSVCQLASGLNIVSNPKLAFGTKSYIGSGPVGLIA